MYVRTVTVLRRQSGTDLWLSVLDPYSSNPDPAKNLNQDPGRQALNPDPDPDPDPSYFFTLPVSEKKLKLCYYNKFLSSKEVT